MQSVLPIALLFISNIFMTFAWYGHLKFRESPIWIVILVSWLIASLEYCFQVPANRIGSYHFSAAQLKIMQEVITLIVFSGFSVFYLQQQLRWNYLVAFLFMIGAVYFVFQGGSGSPVPASAAVETSKSLVPQTISIKQETSPNPNEEPSP